MKSEKLFKFLEWMLTWLSNVLAVACGIVFAWILISIIVVNCYNDPFAQVEMPALVEQLNFFYLISL